MNERTRAAMFTAFFWALVSSAGSPCLAAPAADPEAPEDPATPNEEKSFEDLKMAYESLSEAVKKLEEAESAPAQPGDAGEEDDDDDEAEGEDGDGDIRVQFLETITALGLIRTEECSEFLDAKLEEQTNLGIVGSLVRALGRHGNETALKSIILKGIPKFLQKNAESGNLDLYSGVGSFSVDAALRHRLDPAAEEWLLKRGLTSVIRGHPGAYAAVLKRIARLENPKKNKVLSAELKNARTTEALVALLSVIRAAKPEGVSKGIVRLLKNRKPDVRLAAVGALIGLRIKDKSTRKKYVRLLKDRDWRVQVAAVDSLAMCGEKSEVKKLLPLLKSKKETVKIAVVAALTRLASEKVIEPLIVALDKNKGRVRDDIADALARLTGVDMGPSGAQWESWWASKKETAEIRRRTMAEFIALKGATDDDQQNRRTLLYHGLRVLSDNLTFVIDCSESMEKEFVKKSKSKAGTNVVGQEDTVSRMTVAREELHKVLKGLRNGVSINIVQFNTLILSWRGAVESLNDTLRSDAKKFIDSSLPAGQTNIYGAIETAFDDPKIDTIYLLSDGAPTAGKFVESADVLAAIRDLNWLRKLKINTIGINIEDDGRALLEKLADENFGVFVAR